MDQHALLRLGLLVGTAAVGFSPLLVHRYSPGTRIKQLDYAVEHADLALDPDARARLERQASRRSLWGLIGGGTGFTITMPLTLLVRDVLGDGTPIVAVAAYFLGSAIGMAVSALCPVEPSHDRVRVSALQPHGLRDYLRGYELATEATCAVLGFAAVVVGLIVLRDNAAAQDSVGWIVVIFGAFAGGSAVIAWALERRLLSKPAAAGNESQLVVNDVVLAIGLRDLVGVVTTTTYFAGYLALLALNAAWWLIGLYLIVVVAVNWRFFNSRLTSDLTPVAHRLTARTQTHAT